MPADRVVQVQGAIGDDASDRSHFNPGDVDLYHFRLSGAGQFAFAAEVNAGRLKPKTAARRAGIVKVPTVLDTLKRGRSEGKKPVLSQGADRFFMSK